jgi:hypothetical protein
MAVVGTIVANIMADTAKFEAGMKRAATIHQSTVDKINASSKNFGKGFNNADDWWKGITSAQRQANSSYGRELEAALDRTQREIQGKARETGKSIGDNIAKGLANTIKSGGGSFSNIASALEGVLDNVAVRAAGKIALVVKAADMFVEGSNFMQRQRFLNQNGKALADIVSAREKAQANTPGLLNDATAAMNQSKQFNHFVPNQKEFEQLQQRQRVIHSKLLEAHRQIGLEFSKDPVTKKEILTSLDQAALNAARANFAFEKATGQKGSTFKSVAEARLALSGFNPSLMDVARTATAGGLSMIPLVGEGLGGIIAPDAPTQFEIEKKLNSFNDYLKEFDKGAKEINKTMNDLEKSAKISQQKQDVAPALKGVFGQINKITADIIPSFTKSVSGGLVQFQNAKLDNQFRQALDPALALKNELDRIDLDVQLGRISQDTSYLLAGNAKSKFVSQLGSNFNQTRLFGALQRDSSAAMSAINEAQNRRKSPAEMTQEEQLQEQKRQTDLLRELGKKALIAKGANL